MMQRPDASRILVGLAVSAAFAGAVAAVGNLRGARRHRTPGDTFRGRVVIITGGARGLGLAVARVMAAEGARLVLISRTASELERVIPELQALGGEVSAMVCDIRRPAAVREAIDQIATLEGRIDVLVNNAGIIQCMPFEHAHLEDFEDAMATHFWGPLFLIQACVPIMKRQGGGRIVNVSSIGGRIGVPHLTPYVASKFALVGLSEALHAELAKDQIKVTTVTPGLMRTGSHRSVLVRGQHRQEARWFSLSSATPLTAISPERAAREIVNAARHGQAKITPGWQARIAELANTLTPELVSAVAAMVASRLLPRPVATGEGDTARRSGSIDLGWVEHVLPNGAGVRFNQPASATNNGGVREGLS